MADDDMRADFMKMDAVLKGIRGTSRLFRPPYGEIDRRVFEFVRSKKYHVVGWSMDTNDWKYYEQSDYLGKVMEELGGRAKSKSIVLMHDRDEKSAEVLKEILELVIKTGYKATTVSKCLGINMKNK
ncbi:Glycoside hydrolase/deacetylase, beta/alpha-barrel domain-containing protein [Rozella allomycis CSF55]|uniref:Glycoside hydrolase/deacetylase, beta/alpha-barrel domain-containing protein n=1 Tax=Rozella allomycis (strain CSF55) TaxID=988480 RepID=A0A075AQI2_ROZAC|nr:Glycoside hydrolase/deacetylase, beta/alpha-barrel domain-containing protein [Rozella allomycis CSF55]|eukprot:EPZ30852.1 Glycoside hydrolase/deacetylase, beta/alpha-barrel domain-containing protein [Rozella allomycis CSF55]